MNILHEPSKHDLTELLAELKFGRPAEQQKWLDEKIKELMPKEIGNLFKRCNQNVCMPNNHLKRCVLNEGHEGKCEA